MDVSLVPPCTRGTDDLYGILSEGQIRVLDLVRDEPHMPLRGVLRVVNLDLDHRPQYAALSYAWGDATRVQTIQLGAHGFPITKSLYCALRRLRKNDSTTTVWADALCINQASVLERNQQVAIMADIYSGARMVVVYLGEGDVQDRKRDTLALWMLHELWTIGQAEVEHPARRITWSDLHASLCEAVAEEERMACPCCADPVEPSQGLLQDAFAGIGTLLSQPWFTRMWIVQEVTLRPLVTVLYGGHSMPLAQLTDASMRYLTLADQTSLAPPAVSKLGKGVTDAVLLLTLTKATEARSSVLHLLLETFALRCTEPRDRLYAIRGLAGIATIPTLQPAYDIPIEDVRRELTLHMLAYVGPSPRESKIRSHPSTVLAMAANMANSKESQVKRPVSWVLDFDALSLAVRSSGIYHEAMARTTWAGSNLDFTFHHDPLTKNVLHVPGIITSKISAVDTATQDPRIMLLNSVQTIEDQEEIIAIMIGWYQACWRFVHTDELGAARTFDGDLKKLLDHGYEQAHQDCIEYAVFERIFPQTHVWQDNHILPYNDNAREVYQHLNARLGWRGIYPYLLIDNVMLARTDDGHVGWVPDAVKAGQSVCLLQGAPFPFVVGDSGDGVHYRLMGDAYIPDIMHGEAWPDQKAGVGLIALN